MLGVMEFRCAGALWVKGLISRFIFCIHWVRGCYVCGVEAYDFYEFRTDEFGFQGLPGLSSDALKGHWCLDGCLSKSFPLRSRTRVIRNPGVAARLNISMHTQHAPLLLRQVEACSR